MHKNNIKKNNQATDKISNILDEHPFLKIVGELIYKYLFWLLVSLILLPFVAYFYDSISINPLNSLIMNYRLIDLLDTLAGPWFTVNSVMLMVIATFVFSLSLSLNVPSKFKNDLKKLSGLFFIVIFLYFFLKTILIPVSNPKFMENFIICYVLLLPIVFIYINKYIHSLFKLLMSFITDSSEPRIYPERVTVIWQALAGIAIAIWTIFKFFG